MIKKTLSFRCKSYLASLSIVAMSLGGLFAFPVQAIDLGVEGQVYEPIEEDFRLAMLRLVAKKDWTDQIDNLRDSAENYTKNLPDFFLPLASETKTLWKDVGIVTTEDVYFPSIDWESGSVFEPEQTLAVKAGTYLNPIAQLPSAAIDRLFIFDATSEEQLAFAKELMEEDIPLLNFLIVAGDLGPISKEANRPVYHLTADMIERFQIKSVPMLIGFGKGKHLGHLASTQFTMPVTVDDVHDAWFGLAYPGYDPLNIEDPEVSEEEAASVRAAFSQAADSMRDQVKVSPPGINQGLPSM